MTSFPLPPGYFAGGKDLTTPAGLETLINEIAALATHNVIVTQTEWWIDGLNGSDEATGTTQANALLTHAEFAGRLGIDPVFTQAVTVNIVNGLFDVGVPRSELIEMEATFDGQDAALIYKGYLDPASSPNVSGDVGTFVPMSSTGTNGTEGYFTDDAAQTFAGDEGECICFDPDGTPSYSFITKSYDSNLKARTTHPTRRNGTRKSTSGTTPTNGTAYRSFLLPQIAGVRVKAHRINQGIGAPSTNAATFIFEHLAISGIAFGETVIKASWDEEGNTDDSGGGPSPMFINCILGGRIRGTQALLAGCMFGGVTGPNQVVIDDSEITLVAHCGGYPTFNHCKIQKIGFTGLANSYFDGPLVIQRDSTVSTFISCGVYDFGAPAISTDWTSHALIATVWGTTGSSGVDAYAVRILGQSQYTVVPKIAKGTNAPTDCDIGGVDVNYGSLPHANVVTNGVGGNQAAFYPSS